MTTIELKRVDQDYLMEARNTTGNTILMDGSLKIGGHESAMRPMEVLLASMGGCSAIDVISILKKKRQPVEDINIRLEGEREQGVEPSLYVKIHAHFILKGNIEEAAARQAVELSMDKYCSVAKTLEKTAVVTHSFEIIS